MADDEQTPILRIIEPVDPSKLLVGLANAERRIDGVFGRAISASVPDGDTHIAWVVVSEPGRDGGVRENPGAIVSMGYQPAITPGDGPR